MSINVGDATLEVDRYGRSFDIPAFQVLSNEVRNMMNIRPVISFDLKKEILKTDILERMFPSFLLNEGNEYLLGCIPDLHVVFRRVGNEVKCAVTIGSVLNMHSTERYARTQEEVDREQHNVLSNDEEPTTVRTPPLR